MRVDRSARAMGGRVKGRMRKIEKEGIKNNITKRRVNKHMEMFTRDKMRTIWLTVRNDGIDTEIA